MVVAGRIAELQRLAACERGLAQAYDAFARHIHGNVSWRRLAERHRGHANILAARIRDLGGEPNDESDDQWLLGPTDELATILYAEHTALRTYHDHLLDLDPESMTMVRERILPAHERTVAELTGEAEPRLEP